MPSIPSSGSAIIRIIPITASRHDIQNTMNDNRGSKFLSATSRTPVCSHTISGTNTAYQILGMRTGSMRTSQRRLEQEQHSRTSPQQNHVLYRRGATIQAGNQLPSMAISEPVASPQYRAICTYSLERFAEPHHPDFHVVILWSDSAHYFYNVNTLSMGPKTSMHAPSM